MPTLTTTPIPLDIQRACAARELRLRQRLYPRWVRDGTMTARQAAHELAAMRAIVQTVTALLEAQQLELFATEKGRCHAGA
jgi:hypothetical protein